MGVLFAFLARSSPLAPASSTCVHQEGKTSIREAFCPAPQPRSLLNNKPRLLWPTLLPAPASSSAPPPLDALAPASPRERDGHGLREPRTFAVRLSARVCCRDMCQGRVPVPPLPFQTPTPVSSSPEIREDSEEATDELLHLVLPRHFAPPRIAGSRLFSSGPPSARLTGACARVVFWRRQARDRWVPVVGRLD